MLRFDEDRMTALVAEPPKVDPKRNGKVQQHHEEEPPKLSTTRLCDIESKSVEWLWQDRIPSGMVSMIAGDPGEIGRAHV